MIQITNKTKYPTDKMVELAAFAKQLLPVNPFIYVGNTKYGWKGRCYGNNISIFLPKNSFFPHQYGSYYHFKNLAIPNCKVNWDEVFVEICAHECFHSYQILFKKPKISERDAEAYGVGRLLAHLKLKGIEPPMIKPSIEIVHGFKIINGVKIATIRNKYVWGTSI
jgi:hypothetical protein